MPTALSTMATLVLTLACACGAPERNAQSADEAKGLVGDPAPDFRAKAVTGESKEVALSGLRGQVVLVDFWGTFCEPCKRSFPRLQTLSQKYAGQGLRVVGVSEDEPEDKGKIPLFADTYGAKFALVWDDDKAIARAYKPETMPSSFLIDRQGVVRYAHVGFHDGDEAQLDREIRALLGL
jgi:cytochrome c biogenesis protein CcmG, thiol:disulfide interchange protein DsbE